MKVEAQELKVDPRRKHGGGRNVARKLFGEYWPKPEPEPPRNELVKSSECYSTTFCFCVRYGLLPMPITHNRGLLKAEMELIPDLV